MYSSIEFNREIDKIKYSNIYFIDNDFYYISDNFLDLKPINILGCPTHTELKINDYMFNPNIISNKKLNLFDKDIIEINDINILISHYYDHNIGHGLFDTIYPIFNLLTDFYDKNQNFNCIINLLKCDDWKSNLKCSREWVLDVMQKFSKGNNYILDKLDKNKIYLFKTLLVGTSNIGISYVNKYGIIPGKENFMLEKLRDRIYDVYNIKKKTKKVTTPNILFIKSHRFSKYELLTIYESIKIIKKNKNINILFIDWQNIDNFKNQLELVNDADIYISASGTSMMNFPFLNRKSILINLGTNKAGNDKLNQLMEVNLCLASNDIHVDYYNIFKYHNIKKQPLIDLINKNIDLFFVINKNFVSNSFNLNWIIPNYIKVWRSLFEFSKDKKNLDDFLLKLQKLPLIGYRFPEMIFQNYGPYKNLNNYLSKENIDLLNKLLKETESWI